MLNWRILYSNWRIIMEQNRFFFFFGCSQFHILIFSLTKVLNPTIKHFSKNAFYWRLRDIENWYTFSSCESLSDYFRIIFWRSGYNEEEKEKKNAKKKSRTADRSWSSHIRDSEQSKKKVLFFDGWRSSSERAHKINIQCTKLNSTRESKGHTHTHIRTKQNKTISIYIVFIFVMMPSIFVGIL